MKSTGKARLKGSLISFWAWILWDKDICRGCFIFIKVLWGIVLLLSIVWPWQPFVWQKSHLHQRHRSPNGCSLAEAPLQVWIGFDHITPSFSDRPIPLSSGSLKNGCLRLFHPFSRLIWPENKSVTDNFEMIGFFCLNIQEYTNDRAQLSEYVDKWLK